MEIVLDGESLTTADVLTAARDRARVDLAPEGMERVRRCRAFLDTQIEAGTLMYGVNTGIGELVDVVLKPDQIRDFQRYLVNSHAAGYGDPLPEAEPQEVDSAPESKGTAQEPPAAGEYTLKQALRSSVFWLLALAFFFFFGMAHSTVTVHTVPAHTDAGIPETRAAFSFGLLTLVSVIGRLSSPGFRRRSVPGRCAR